VSKVHSIVPPDWEEWARTHLRPKKVAKEIVILHSFAVGCKHAIHLHFKDADELNKVVEALTPLGYTFRRPKGR